MRRLRRLLHPPILCGLRWLLPGEGSPGCDERRRVFRDAFAHLPRWQWWMARLAFVVIWLGFGAWRAWWRGTRLAARLGPQLNLPAARVRRDLPWLVFWMGATPTAYFQYRLYEQPRREWLAFIFPNEQAVWLSATPANAQGRAALADKAGFAAALTAAGLPAVPTERQIARGAAVPEKDLFVGRPLFLKPNSANAQRGCLELQPEPATDTYRLTGKDLAGLPCAVTGRAAIVACLTELFAREPYLVQPLLRNHLAWQPRFPTERLLTLRVITQWTSTGAMLLYAGLEVPVGDRGTWHFVPLNLATGHLAPSQNPLAPLGGHADALHAAVGTPVPEWPRCCELARAAHQLTPDVALAGWDLAVTPEGPVLIEGNPGWNVLPPQSGSGVPLLRRLAEVRTPAPAVP